jgi:hypothetical protein
LAAWKDTHCLNLLPLLSGDGFDSVHVVDEKIRRTKTAVMKATSLEEEWLKKNVQQCLQILTCKYWTTGGDIDDVIIAWCEIPTYT